MTEATAPRIDIGVQDTVPTINYLVAMPQPETHLFEVSLQIVNYSSPILDLRMPVWTPGSYLVREYAKNLQDFTAFAGDKILPWRKISKNHWQINKGDVSEVTVRYRIFANELSVRTNHLDATHGYFNGAALFFRLPGWENLPICVTVIPPYPQWRVTTPLPTIGEQSNTFYAADFDTLVDSPFEIGEHQLYHFEVLGKPHELAIWGQGNCQVQQLIRDTQKIIQIEAQMFGGLPYERYVFLLHLFAQAYGGLEHKNSCSLIYQRFGFRSQDKYERFIQLLAHEFFHLWNVKRIRPQALEVFNYDQENYTPSLWFCEGTTSYYDLLIPLRAGIYDAKTYLNYWSKEISRLITTPGRKVQPLSESSFDAWIKLYRPDTNTGNSQVSYYLKGEMISLLLDLLIRARYRNQRSLDDVMRQMWQKFGQAEIGYTPEQLQAVIESVAGVDLTDFFARYIDGTEELPFNQYLEPFGLHLVAEREEEPYLGVKVNTENGREMIKFVEAGSPAQMAGIDAGDELLAIAGIKITAHQLSDRLKDYQANDTIQVTVFHQDELRTYPVKLGTPRPTKYQLLAIQNPNATQQENFAAWLGAAISTVS
ncbi:M61 family metallopeptidase [Anabaena sp. FACHB-709]|uniref:Peptidase M61 domain-containing protein n=3 Tax=Nostocaceae TaxID=1162 RepID=A0A1Z4KG35_ANAVA|nr:MULTISPECIES: M61 family metallopeptidase [Nostocaceae]BAY67950.1 peptidase M61 domain-containing protein [Trichormus variabilis NIES-23]HBW29698.1 M61 family peptidase [Nostoc sp. UBA8866]MBD2169960.1 M61 family metallopeptidase [Anabaena cylindrica FACHB-318]MBD2261620.1 M61 family metallopeptidase [Anabaena sp. FACHB-709]MBD2271204.1 M61 family metallopeptidase [Nostoc sp. PCC 7120 = FACHB-418]